MNLSGVRYWYLRRVVGTMLGAIGFGPSTRVARWLGRGLWDLRVPARDRAERRIEAVRCGGVPHFAEPSVLSRSCFEHIGRFWIETLFSQRKLTGSWRRVIQIEKQSELALASADSGPAIFVTGWLGHPGVAAFALGQLCRPIHVPIDWALHPALRVWQADLYRRRNVRLVSRERALPGVSHVLEAGGKVMFVGEHVRADGRGDEVTFLGRSLRCHQTVRLLSRRFEAPVHVVACPRRGEKFGFRLRYGGVVRPDEENITQAWMSRYEALILEDPEQYLWTLGDESGLSSTSAAQT